MLYFTLSGFFAKSFQLLPSSIAGLPLAGNDNAAAKPSVASIKVGTLIRKTVASFYVIRHLFFDARLFPVINHFYLQRAFAIGISRPTLLAIATLSNAPNLQHRLYNFRRKVPNSLIRVDNFQ